MAHRFKILMLQADIHNRYLWFLTMSMRLPLSIIQSFIFQNALCSVCAVITISVSKLLP